jgi:hypothetical protein
MELKHLTENFLFVAAFVVAFLPLIYVFLFRFNKTVGIVVLASLALALLLVVHRPTQDFILARAVPTPVVHEGMMPSRSIAGIISFGSPK